MVRICYEGIRVWSCGNTTLMGVRALFVRGKRFKDRPLANI